MNVSLFNIRAAKVQAGVAMGCRAIWIERRWALVT